MSDACFTEYDSKDLKTVDIPKIHKNFGTVDCGKEVIDTFEVKNNKNIPITMAVAKHENVTRNYGQTFTIAPKSVKVAPGKSARFKITFLSHSPDIVYHQKYLISDEYDSLSLLVVHCKSTGPSIKAKNFKLTFFLLRNARINTKRVELHNQSSCPAKFRFDDSKNIQPFQLSSLSGQINGGGKKILDIKFIPPKQGVYHRKVYCLFQYHEPVIFILVGIYNLALKTDPKDVCLNLSITDKISDNFKDYMKNLNEVCPRDEKELCIEAFLQRNIIKFTDNMSNKSGRLSFDTEENSSNAGDKEKNCVLLTKYYLNVGSELLLTKALKIINTSNFQKYNFEWNSESESYFSISPKTGCLHANQLLDLQIHFKPDLPDRLYNGDFHVRIFSSSNEINPQDTLVKEIDLPSTLNLSITGHSFKNDIIGWVDQCEIEPRIVLLPSCVPGETVYSTFMLKKFGHLPVIYEFIPPKTSHIKIKPPLGYISDSFQLFVVQFDAPNDCEGSFEECWRIVYNLSSKQFNSIQFFWHLEKPKIILGENNCFTFPTLLPGARSGSAVPIHNPTDLTIRYDFCIPEQISWIEIPKPSAELNPLGRDLIDITFKPSEPKEYLDHVCCHIMSVKMPNYVISEAIQLKGSCQDGLLVGTPTFYDFGKCLYEKEEKTSFYMFNFTPVCINFKLIVKKDKFPSEDRENIVNIIPKKGTISGKSNVQIEVSIIVNKMNSSKYCVQCLVLESDSGDPLPCYEPRTLFTVKIEGTLPNFQIIDLNVEGGGPLISPHWLWKMMNINGLNKALQNLLPNEKEYFDIRLPEALKNSSPIIIYLLLEAKNSHEMYYEVCKHSQIHMDIKKRSEENFKNENFNVMNIIPRYASLKTRCQEVLKITLVYCAEGYTFYKWSISLSQNRLIYLRSVITCIASNEEAQSSAYLDSNFNLNPVFIGDLTPPVQLFWLYNNTSNYSKYVLDKLKFREAIFTPEIFDCLNPNGVIPPFSSIPLIFTFKPNESKQYKVNTLLCLKCDEVENLTLTGSGTLSFSPFTEFGHEKSIPQVPILKEGSIPVQASIKLFNIEPFQTFSSAIRVFFLENKSKNADWLFHWHSFFVKDIVKAYVEPVEALLKPGEKKLMKVTVESLYHPTNIGFSITCDVIDYSALQAYENALQLKEIAVENSKDYFTITERGITYETSETFIPEKPGKNHIFIAIQANIVSSQATEIKIAPRNRKKFKSGREIVISLCESPITEENERIINETLEKLLWNILKSPTFVEQLGKYNERFGSVSYSQILPRSEKEAASLEKRLACNLPTYNMQSILENMIIKIFKKICKNDLV